MAATSLRFQGSGDPHASSSWQIAEAHQVGIHRAGRSSPFGDRPDNQRLTAATIAGGKHSGHVRGERTISGSVIGARIAGDPQFTGDTLFGSQEPQRQENQVSLPDVFGSRDFPEGSLSIGMGPVDSNGPDSRDMAASVADELLRQHGVLPRVFPQSLAALFVGVIDPKDAGPLPPGIVGRPLWRELIEQLKIHDTLAAMSQ